MPPPERSWIAYKLHISLVFDLLERVGHQAQDEQHDTEGEDVSVCSLVCLASHELGSHIHFSAEPSPVEAVLTVSCQCDPVAEIDQLDLERRREHDILGLDVPMRDARRVQPVQCLRYLQEDGSNVLLVLPLRLVEEVDQLYALNDFHDKEADLSGRAISLGPSSILHEFLVLGD